MPCSADRALVWGRLIALAAAVTASLSLCGNAWAARALVANNGAVDSVTFLDLGGGTSISITHDELKGPRWVAVTDDGHFAGVTNGDGKTVSWIDLRDQSAPVYLGKTFVDASPRGIAIRGNIAVVAVDNPTPGSTDALKVIAIGGLPGIPHDLQVTSVDVGVDANPEGVAITPDGRYALVARAGVKKLAYVDLSGPAPVLLPKGTKMKKGAFGVAITPDGTKALVTGNTLGTLTIIDLTGLPVVPGPGALTTYVIGSAPAGVAITPDGAAAVVAEAGTPDVARIVDLAALTSTPVPLGTPADPDPNPFGAATWRTAGGPRAAVTNTAAETISIMDVTTKAVILTIDSGPAPQGLALIPPGPPTALLAASTPTGAIPLSVTFDGSKSFDRDGIVTSYTFDFGDGNVVTSPTPIVLHTYETVGKFTASLAVTDDDGLSSSKNSTTSVQAEANRSPKATLRANPTSGRVPLAVTFDGSKSADSDGTIASYTFTFGDGTTLTTPDPIVTHTYATAGKYAASLTVTDNGGAPSTKANAGVQVKANKPPTAAFRMKPSAGPAPLTVAFTDQSKDSDGQVVGVQWSFGDGSSSTERNPTHTYTAPGTYTVRLTVTDDSGATAQKTSKVEARED